MKFFIVAWTAALSFLLPTVGAHQTPTPEVSIPGVVLAVDLTNNVLTQGSQALLKCWITNNSTRGLVLRRSMERGTPGEYHFEVWLRARTGNDYVLIPSPRDGAPNMADTVGGQKVRGYSVPLPIASNIPPGRYVLRAKRQVSEERSPALLSNPLDVQVKLAGANEPTHQEETVGRKPGLTGVRLAVALTNSILVAGSNTLLNCWLTNDSTRGLSLQQVGVLEVPESYCFQIWLRAGDGKEYALTRDPGAYFIVSRRAERIKAGEVRSYHLALPIPAEIPSGRYQLRAKRELHGPGTEVLSNTLEVEVEAQDSKEKLEKGPQ
jgi:hypothetical protein